jgi:hypothetical protein
MGLLPNARGVVVDGGYDRVSPYHLLGAKPAGMLDPHAVSQSSHLSAATVSSIERNEARPWHPDNPLFWFGGLLLVTFGLIGAATSVRVGPFKASVGAGKP